MWRLEDIGIAETLRFDLSTEVFFSGKRREVKTFWQTKFQKLGLVSSSYDCVYM